MSHETTVAALSSGIVPSGVAVIRISGPRTRFALETIAGIIPDARMASLRMLRDPVSNAPLDQALVLYFPKPHSFTGEDVGELHCHGSRAVVDGVLKALWSLDGIGEAAAGDFTRQAFANGKLDLVQVEALGDLIHASTSGQRDLALAHLSGAASRKLERWRDELAHIRAMIEAELDFSDEDDVPGSVLDSLPERLRALSGELEADLSDRYSERLRDGFRVVLAGAPNSGKSTLMNALLERDAALVSPIAGTTRDRIDAALDIDGLPVLLSDTAGLRGEKATDDPIEALGIDRAKDALAEADCVIWLEGGDQTDELVEPVGSIRVRSKSDIIPTGEIAGGYSVDLIVSGKTGEGLAGLRHEIRSRLMTSYGQGQTQGRVAGGTISVDARRRTALQSTHRALCAAMDGLRLSEPPLDLIAEDLRRAQTALAAVSGDVDAEGVLDVVFSSFCIGK